MLTIGTDAGLRDIANRLDGLPLALATAGSYLFQTSMTASKYLQHHNTSWLELQRTSPQLLSYEDQTIYTTWNMSYIHIRKADMSVAKLLEFWAYFDSNDLWYDLLQAGNDDEAPDWFCHILRSELAFEAAVLKLQNHALVHRSKDSQGYSMHHCVHAWVKNVLFKTIEDQSMRLAIACVGKSIPKGVARDDWITKRRLLPHSERCLKLTRDWDKEGRAENETCIAHFFDLVGWLHLYQGRMMEAEPTILRAHQLFEKVYGSLHMFTLNVASILARVYELQGRVPEAESMYMQTLIRCEQILGPDDKNTLSTVGCLALIYGEQGKLKDAESMTQRALIGFEKTLGPNHAFTLSVLKVLGTVYAKQNRLEEAESMYLQALLCHERAFGSDHPSTLETVNDLGVLYRNQGRLTEAESMYQGALTGFEKSLGPDHTSTLATVKNLGLLYNEQDKLKEAEQMFLRALLGYTRNPSDPRMQLHLFYNIGLLYQDMQSFEKAKEFFSQAYQGLQELLGTQHDNTIRALIRVNIEMARKEKPAAFASGVISTPVPERNVEAELWASIEKSVVEEIRDSNAVNTSRARQSEEESEEESESHRTDCSIHTNDL